ncbi:hypothetical protein [Proteiniborus ethanoligenes]|uniref:hypothetical protein n=1 Tax=Proteiniborus ethanoligenes TaxID=415015 RepID=UPI001FCAB49E|nr:hypothetical protein [Proteiniborus ethanoligenes]
MIKENDVAASITPAAKPSIVSKVLEDTFLVKKIGIAPIPVENPANMLVIIPMIITFSELINFVIQFPFLM